MTLRTIIYACGIVVFASTAHAMQQATAEKIPKVSKNILENILHLYKNKQNETLKRLIPGCLDLIQHPRSSLLHKCLQVIYQDGSKATILNPPMLVLLITHNASLCFSKAAQLENAAECMNTVVSEIEEIDKQTASAEQKTRREEYCIILDRLVKAFEQFSQSAREMY